MTSMCQATKHSLRVQVKMAHLVDHIRLQHVGQIQALQGKKDSNTWSSKHTMDEKRPM